MVTGKIGEAWVDIQANMKPFNRAVAGLSSKLKAIGSRMQSVGRQATTKLTLPIAAAGGAAGKMALDFEEALTKMESLVGLSASEVKNLKGEIQGMAGEVGKSPQELAEAMFFITSAGQRGSTALNTLKASAKASAAGLGEVKTIADAATSAMNAYGAENLSASQATSTMIASVREGKLEASEMASSLGQVIPVASQLGISFNDVGAQMAAMSRLGLSARKAATAMRGIMRGLVKPSDKAKKQLQEVGLSVEGLRNKVKQGDVITVLQELKSAFSGNAEAMSNVFPRIRGLIGAMSLTGENADKAREIMEELNDTAGATERAFGSVQEKGFQKTAEATSDFQNALTKFGDAVKRVAVPMLTKLAELINRIVDYFKALPEKTQDKFIKGIMALAGIGPALIALGAGVAAIGSLIGGITSLSSAMASIATIGPVVQGVLTALGTSLTALWDDNKNLMENLKSIWGTIKNVFKSAAVVIKTTITTVWNVIRPILRSLIGLIEEIITQLTNGLVEGVDFSGMFDSFEKFNKAIRKMGNIVEKSIGAITKAIGNLIRKLDTLIEKIKAIKNVVQPIASFFSSGFGMLQGLFDSTIGSAIRGFMDLEQGRGVQQQLYKATGKSPSLVQVDLWMKKDKVGEATAEWIKKYGGRK